MQDNFYSDIKIPPEQDINKSPFLQENVAFVPYGEDPKEYSEKKQIKKAALTAGISLIILLTVSFVFGLVYSLFSAEIDFTTGSVNLNQNPAVQHFFQIVISLLSFTLPFIFVYRLKGYRISDLVSFKKSEKEIAIPLFFFGVAFCAFSNISSSYMDSVFKAFGIDFSIGDYDLPKGIFGFGLTFLSTAVVPALAEEFACRGIILGSLRKFGDAFAVISSAVIFGLLHGNFEQMPFAFLMGLFLGFSVVKTNSLRVAMVIHFFNNFISVFFNYFLADISVNIQNTIYLVFLLLSLLIGIYFLKSKENATVLWNFEKSEFNAEEKQKYKWFFGSAAMIFFAVLCLIEAFSFLL